MNSSEQYKWIKVVNGTGFVGIISLEVQEKNPKEQNEVVEDYNKSEQILFENWKEGIRKGLEFALSKVSSRWKVTIKGFEGSNVGTNSCVAACTAMFAFWDKIGFQAEKKLANAVEQFVSRIFLKQMTVCPTSTTLGTSNRT